MITITQNRAGGTYALRCEQYVDAYRDKVFEFFSDASQLERLTPPWLNFSVLTPKSVAMGEGTLIDFKLRVFGMPLRWRSRIECWDPPYQFSDVQVRGPYRLWNHLHRFEQVGEGTLCLDEVEYAVWGGSLVHRLFVEGELRKIFAYRSKVLAEMFAGS